MSEPDFDRLKELGAEAQRLRDDGEWTKENFDRLLAEAKKASAGHGEFLGFLLLHADHDW
jgi:hypothetical protein